MKDFIKKNKKTILLLILFIVLSVFTFYKFYNKGKEESQQQNKVQYSPAQEKYEKDNKGLQFLPYRIINDRDNKKIMLVFAKSETDYSSDFKYYIMFKNEKKEMNQFQNDEHMLVLEADLLVDDNFKVIMENNRDSKDKREVELNLQEAKKYDLTKATKDKFNEHEKLSHHIISNQGAIKSAEKTLKEQEELLKFTDEKIEEYNKQGKTESVARYKKAKEEVISEISKQTKIKEEKKKELDKLFKENEQLERMFDVLFGGLHKH